VCASCVTLYGSRREGAKSIVWAMHGRGLCPIIQDCCCGVEQWPFNGEEGRMKKGGEVVEQSPRHETKHPSIKTGSKAL
jgi:hypothetical protein